PVLIDAEDLRLIARERDFDAFAQLLAGIERLRPLERGFVHGGVVEQSRSQTRGDSRRRSIDEAQVKLIRENRLLREDAAILPLQGTGKILAGVSMIDPLAAPYHM